MNNKPIGVFDSGVGGLTVVKELHKILPGEAILYLGDTGRVPYGNRSRKTIRKYAGQDINFLTSLGVKQVTAACGTVSTTITSAELEGVSIPFLGIVEPSVSAAVRATKNGKIGVIATSASIKSGAYAKVAGEMDPGLTIFGRACPLLVPLTENGLINFENQITRLTLQMYLDPLSAEGIDTLILGCTHFPLLYDIIDDLLKHKVTLINSGAETALAVKNFLTRENMLNDSGRQGNTTYYVSDSVNGFQEVASIFLGDQLRGDVRFVDLDFWT